MAGERSTKPAFDVARFKEVMGTFPTGVSVVTATSDGSPVGFTCQSVVSLSLEPAYVALAPSKASTSWPLIARAGSFCVNVLRDDQAELARRFAVAGPDKFEGFAWSPGGSGAPLISGAIAWAECELELTHDAGDHEIVVGRVLDVGLAERPGSPLVFYRSAYHRLGGRAGQTGGSSARSTD